MNNKKARPAKPEKTNPHGSTSPPWLARSFAAVQWRCLVRDVLGGQAGPQALEDMLGSFAPATVRGDYVPTISTAYAQLLALANAHSDALHPQPPLTPQVQTIFTPDGRFRVEVRFTPATPNQKQKAKT